MKSSSYRTNNNYLLAGKAFCASCGAKVSGTSGKSQNGTKYCYYGCSHHHRSARYEYCETKNIRADVLEKLVCDKTHEILSSKKAIKEIARQAVKLRPRNESELEIRAIKNHISSCQKKIDNCIKAIENGVMSNALVESLNENERTLDVLKEKLAKASLMQGSGLLTEEKIQFFFETIREKAKETEKYNDILLTSLVRAVYICNEYVEIQYNYAEQLPILTNPVRIESCSYKCTNGGTIWIRTKDLFDVNEAL